MFWLGVKFKQSSPKMTPPHAVQRGAVSAKKIPKFFFADLSVKEAIQVL